jgi:hypothetical protein
MTTVNLTIVPQGTSPLDVLAARHRAAWDKVQHGRQEWVEGTLELASVLAEERKLLPDNTDFSRWLERNGLAKIDKNVRAALIGMAGDLAATREALEKTDNTNWRYIWETKLRKSLSSSAKTRQAPVARQSKTERQLIDRVLNLHLTRGYSFDQTAAELGLTKGKVAGIVFRNSNTNSNPAPQPPAPKPREYKGLDSKTLTREQVDPDFKGDAVQFATKYGHVLLHTKTEIEENKRQEVLRAWQAAITDIQQTARALGNAEAPDPDTLRQWLSKPGKARKLQVWLAAIETAYLNIAPYLDLVRSEAKEPAE